MGSEVNTGLATYGPARTVKTGSEEMDQDISPPGFLDAQTLASISFDSASQAFSLDVVRPCNVFASIDLV